MTWLAANQTYLMAAIAPIRVALQQLAAPGATSQPQPSPVALQQAIQTAKAALPGPAALDQICATFGLSEFERDVLLLCAGVELDTHLARLCADIQGDSQRPFPTFSLALSALPNAHWSALSPRSPLRRWQLIEVGSGKTLTLSPLRIDERILHALTGVYHLDDRLTGLIKSLTYPLTVADALVPSHQTIADRLTSLWSTRTRGLTVVQLCSADSASHRAIARTACHTLNLNLHSLSTLVLPTHAADLTQLIRLWEREAILTHSALLLDCEDAEAPDPARDSAIARLLEEITSPLILSTRDRRRPPQRPMITFDIQPPTHAEQRLLWQRALSQELNYQELGNQELERTIDHLVAQFSLGAVAIQTVCAECTEQPAFAPPSPHPPPKLSSLWASCRTQARPRLDELAQRMDSSATWEDLVLPDAQKSVLKAVVAHVRQRSTVYETWGFGGKSGRGLGITALLAGASGTGKTMAAEIMAQELQLDLYRIDLSQVVSKYIGETEKNLRRVFDAAEAGGVVLLFDEADSLFGKRSEVKDSHDRYANMEVSYLLQRMESYRGLAILTTNLKDAIDQAFLRRIRFIVKFPFPDVTQRMEIWRRAFPPQTPTAGLEINKLAQLGVAGGNIRNIALNAAFIAADAEEAVQMKHILAAAQSEYTKLERTLTSAEIKGWI